MLVLIIGMWQTSISGLLDFEMRSAQNHILLPDWSGSLLNIFYFIFTKKKICCMPQKWTGEVPFVSNCHVARIASLARINHLDSVSYSGLPGDTHRAGFLPLFWMSIVFITR